MGKIGGIVLSVVGLLAAIAAVFFFVDAVEVGQMVGGTGSLVSYGILYIVVALAGLLAGSMAMKGNAGASKIAIIYALLVVVQIVLFYALPAMRDVYGLLAIAAAFGAGNFATFMIGTAMTWILACVGIVSAALVFIGAKKA